MQSTEPLSPMHMVKLVSPNTEKEWDAYHSIRERILWEARGLFGVYDRNNPDEYMDNHFPKLILLDGVPIGVVRIDLIADIREAGFRRVAILEDQQGQGYGQELLRLSEGFAAGRGYRKFSANVSRTAIGFWEKLGYSLDPEHPGNNPEFPRMVKQI